MLATNAKYLSDVGGANPICVQDLPWRVLVCTLGETNPLFYGAEKEACNREAT